MDIYSKIIPLYISSLAAHGLPAIAPYSKTALKLYPPFFALSIWKAYFYKTPNPNFLREKVSLNFVYFIIFFLIIS